MVQVKVHTFNFMFVCKAKVGVSVSVLENLSDFVFFYDIDKKKIELRGLLMTLVQLQSFNNQVGWNTDLLPDARVLFQTTTGNDFLFITNVLHNIVFFSPLTVIKISHQTPKGKLT